MKTTAQRDSRNVDGSPPRCPLSSLASAARRQFPVTITITICRMDPANAALSKILIPRGPEHMLPYQNPAMSLPLPCGTAHVDNQSGFSSLQVGSFGIRMRNLFA
jgi:hypothetical protein